ncbi:MAG: cell division protein ZapA [Saprospiraceae bacterium]
MEADNMVKITVIIGGRPYPLRVAVADEPAIRKIVSEVNDKINTFQTTYHGRDRQDALSMTLLTYAYDLFKLRQEPPPASDPKEVVEQLTHIDELLTHLL